MIKLLRLLRTAIRALSRNVTRALLTMLGIVIGIAAVIAMMEVGQGASAAIQKSISSMGSNTLLVLPGASVSSGISWGTGSNITLTSEDCDAIVRECPDVNVAADIIRINSQVVYANRNWNPNQIFGTSPAYLEVRDWVEMSEGVCFSEHDVRNSSMVCVVGQTIKKELFQGESPVGKFVRISNINFRVVGLLSPKGANLMGQDQDDLVMMPWTTAKYRISNTKTTGQTTGVYGSAATSNAVNSLSALYPAPTDDESVYPEPTSTEQADYPLPVRFDSVNQIIVGARSAASIHPAIDEITELLRERHHLHEDADNDFTIRDMTELMNTLSSTSKMMTNLLLIVALISLVVGGVGIMNIMLVSVTERTREIGLRMAIGARNYDILLQFLIEAVLLCLVGGIIGITLGRFVSIMVAVSLHWPTQVSVDAIILSVIVSTGVGVVFGFYPAWRASILDPIEALRYE